jgi:hypothetical protein
VDVHLPEAAFIFYGLCFGIRVRNLVVLFWQIYFIWINHSLTDIQITVQCMFSCGSFYDASGISNYTTCNWKVKANFRHKLHLPKQEKMSISTCVRKCLICELQLKEYREDTGSSSALICGQGLLESVCWALMFGHIGLHKISSYTICLSYWKMYHWQSEHECGTCMMVLRHLFVVLCEMSSITSIMTDGPGIVWLLRSPDLNPLDLYLWGHLKALVYTAPVDNEDTHNHACQTICDYPAISERTRLSVVRSVQACIESHGGHFVHFL